ncbi:hypothetical protein AB0C33_02060 [Nonomuraea sp. NPDC048881]|uniref:hypothetical protein n=1 Tax=Nonomuraea sp. NPDC048881 TaxID=3155030 RepID=UPI00340609A7
MNQQGLEIVNEMLVAEVTELRARNKQLRQANNELRAWRHNVRKAVGSGRPAPTEQAGAPNANLLGFIRI